MGYDLNQETVYVAKVRLLEELYYPVPAGASVRIPHFAEVEKILMRTTPSRGSVWGVIRGTEALHGSLPGELCGLAPLCDGETVTPQEGVPLIFDYRSMQDYPHIGVFGGSGSGKSFGLRVIIEEFLEHRIPMLILDPHYEMSFGLPFSDRMPRGFA
jgi:DNA helicase HerA-like ATPase